MNELTNEPQLLAAIPKNSTTRSATPTVKPLKSDVRLSLITFLASLLATCSTSPSYAEVGKSRFSGNPTFVEELNKIKVMPSSIEVDLVAVSGNNSCSTPYCVVRFGDLLAIGVQPHPYAVFLRTLYPARVVTVCMGIPSGMPVPIAGSPTLYSPSPKVWRLLEMVNSDSIGVSHD